MEEELLARKLHEWYLEACSMPESGFEFNSAAQEPYDSLTDGQKFLDLYIAKQILIHLAEELNNMDKPNNHECIAGKTCIDTYRKEWGKCCIHCINTSSLKEQTLSKVIEPLKERSDTYKHI